MALFFEETRQPFGFLWTFPSWKGQQVVSPYKDRPLGFEFSAPTSSNQPHWVGACKMPDPIVWNPHSNQETSFTVRELLSFPSTGLGGIFLELLSSLSLLLLNLPSLLLSFTDVRPASHSESSFCLSSLLFPHGQYNSCIVDPVLVFAFLRI